MNPFILLLPFHILGAVIWVGGMFFAHVMLRPSVGPLEPPARLTLWARVFGRFFPWVWVCIVALFASGLAMQGLGMAGPYVDVMAGIGVVMVLAYAHLFFSPYKRFRRAVAGGDFPEAGRQINQIRHIVTFNLVLGLIVVIVGATGPYWG